MRTAATALAALLLMTGCARAQSDQPQQSPTVFMAQNALAEGVHTLPTGEQYKIISSGPGTSRHPTPKDYVTVEYEGTLLNGQIFDSTAKNGGKPATFQLGDLIPGWIDVMQQMKEGDEWIIWVPPSLGYGAQQKGPIPGNSVLVFRLKLVSILGG